MKLTLTMLVCTFFAAIQPAYSQGYIVPNGVIKYDGYTGPGIEVDALYNPTASPPTIGDYTGFILYPRNTDTYLYGGLATVDVRAFLVPFNDPVTLETIQSGSYTELISGNDYVLNNGIAFYVGIYTGRGSPTAGIFPDPVFGWAALVNNNGQMELLDSALEYGGDGIYAGTLDIIQPVPEPTTWALTAFGGLLLAWHCKRSQAVSSVNN